MEILKAILHIIDKDSGQLICSQAELDLRDFHVSQYMETVLKRLDKGEYKHGILSADNDIVPFMQEIETNFIKVTQDISQKMFDVLAISEDAPSGDVLFLETKDLEENHYLVVIKFNYKPQFTHHVTYVDDVMQNNIILNQTVFPAVTQKIDECFMINLTDLSTKVIEKRYMFEGEKRYYFTERLLQLDPLPTVSEKLNIVKKAVKQVAKRYNEEEYVSMSQAQQAIFESIESDGIIDTQKVADVVFKDNISAKEEYQDIIEKTKFTEDIPENIVKYEKKYSKQKFKLANGIELSIPSDVFNDANMVEFINNPDGTISVMIKNIEEIISKF
ncbi:nucleoid-associated protein [Vagococcus luciliae]|uniref:Nucleoid-associated protein n=1 Tax=Vagococcus luciliae TaxID=2920380 RepID=A0ABY5NZX9_9ENTE|nr:nucleoid-associated protein [Vagococcus luciliae]UUV99114.1 hypothetical protein G314FT_12730 [Vagococcus luciliae]